MRDPGLAHVPAMVIELLLGVAPLPINWADISLRLALQDLGFDSFALQALLIELEDRFGIEVHESDIVAENFATVGSVIDYVTMHIPSCDRVPVKGR